MSQLPPLKVQDAAQFGRVGLVIGGRSAERQVSLSGGKAVGEALRRNRIEFEVFDGPMPLFEAIRRGEIDRVFNLLHGPDALDISAHVLAAAALSRRQAKTTACESLPRPHPAQVHDGREVLLLALRRVAGLQGTERAPDALVEKRGGHLRGVARHHPEVEPIEPA